MTDITTENSAFTKIVDTIYDSKVLNGLVTAGVLPPTFRVIKATADLTDVAATTNVPLLDATTGVQVQLGEQSAILYAAVYALSTVTSGGSPTFSIGLATAADGANATTTLIFGEGATINTALTLTALNAGRSTYAVDTAAGNIAPALRGVTLSTLAAGTWLQAQVNVATTTGGEIAVILVVV